jgi:rhodanese-related sulfurtransferase
MSAMKRIIINAVACLYILPAIAQYKNDNVLYKTVFPEDLCSVLSQQKGYIILDVRSPGEYADTSSNGLNIGHLKNAININVSDLGKNLALLNDLKDKPVFVYCSHSQRSRRASKMLADSGFRHVFNINGGMTAIQQLPVSDCTRGMVQTGLGYKFIPAVDLCKKMAGNKNDFFLLDIRPDSAFAHNTTDAKINAMGYFNNSWHIALSNLASHLPEIPANKEIIIIDLFGNDADSAAVILEKNHYKNITVLTEGIDRFLQTDSRRLQCKPGTYISPVNYHIISVPELSVFTQTKKDYLVLDIRSKEEFTNKHANYWMNIGHMAGAVNIPLAVLNENAASIMQYKTRPVLLYSFGSGKAVYEAANLLAKLGFTDLNILSGGLFNIRWTAANVKGNASLVNLVEDTPDR